MMLKDTKKLLMKTVRKDYQAWMIMLPTLLMFVVFYWQPLISGIVLSFFKTKGFNAVSFAGLENYIYVISNSSFKAALVNTFSYTFWSLVIGFTLPLIVGLLLNEIIHFNAFFKFVYYLPSMIPAMATYLMWAFMYNPSDWGILNQVLLKGGWHSIGWLNVPELTIPLIVTTMTWSAFGGTTLIYMASLQGINQEMYEAASLDGAGFFSKVFHITIPSLKSVIILMLVMQIISVFQVLVQPLSMTGGGPNEASLSLMLQSYFYAFNRLEAGHSMAVGVITFGFLLVPTIIYFILSKRYKD